MSGLDDPACEELRCAGFFAPDGEWSFATFEREIAAEKALAAPEPPHDPVAVAPPAPLPERIDQEIAVVRAAIAAGLPVRSVTINGVDLQLNDTAPAAPAGPPQSGQSPAPPGLLTRPEAAARLHCSVKIIDQHVAAGALRYVAIGRSKKHPRRMFAESDLEAFVHRQTREEQPLPCPSTNPNVRRIGRSTSRSPVIAFTARRKQQPGGPPKP